MGTGEKILCSIYLVVLGLSHLVGLLWADADWGESPVPYPLVSVGALLGIAALAVIIRDIYKREVLDRNAKLAWAVLVVLFLPTAFLYLPIYGFKPRRPARLR
jgi:membrane protease YdiL (CAAX protease family)